MQNHIKSSPRLCNNNVRVEHEITWWKLDERARMEARLDLESPGVERGDVWRLGGAHERGGDAHGQRAPMSF